MQNSDNNKPVIILIIVLSFFLLIVILGIIALQPENNILTVIYNFFFRFGNSASDIVNTSGDVIANTSKFGISLSNNVIHDLGNMIKGQPTTNTDNGDELKLDITIQKGPAK